MALNTYTEMSKLQNWSLDIFLCEFQAPDGRTENSPGLQPGFKRLSEKGVLG